MSVAALEAKSLAAGPPRGFASALCADPIAVIAEVKRASPSAGPIRPDADPAKIAAEYAQAGANAISCLTDEQFFDGKLSFIADIRSHIPLPVLRKDFIIDPYQVVEARAAGADAILLIVAALSPSMLKDLLIEARRWNLDALVEIHNSQEAERAVAAGAKLIGVNHRDLATFTIDMTLTASLRAQLPSDTVLVGESGIRCGADVAKIAQAGAQAVLIGEHLMRAPSPGQALHELKLETKQCLSRSKSAE